MAGGERTVRIKFTGEAKDVQRAAKQAEKAVDGAGKSIMKSAAGFAEKIGSGIMSAVDAIPPLGKPIALALGAGLATALAPVLGAAIGSAVLLAVGGGALALGIKAAMDSPKVTAAFDPLKKKMAKLSDSFGKPFEGPLVRAAKTFSTLLDNIRPAVERIGKTIAPVIDKLAPAFSEFLKRAMPGIEKAVAASVPLFETLAEKLPFIGDAISKFFEAIAEGGPGANAFFADLLDAIGYIIIGLGKAIGKLASWYIDLKAKIQQAKDLWVEFKVVALGQIGRLLDGAVKALSWIPGIGPKLQKAQSEFRTFQQEANAELKKIRDRNVSVTISTNIGRIAAEYSRLLSGITSKSTKPGKRASGGPVRTGGTYLVGERGVELLHMGGNGRVTPNRDLKTGGDTFEIHVDLGDQVRQVIRVQNRDLKRRTGARAATA